MPHLRAPYFEVGARSADITCVRCREVSRRGSSCAERLFEDVFTVAAGRHEYQKNHGSRQDSTHLSLSLLLRKTPPAQHAEPPAYPMNMDF